MLVAALLAAALSTAAPPALESAQQRVARFAAWRRSHRDASSRARRIVTETLPLAAAYLAKPADDAISRPSVIFNTRDAGAILWECPNCPQMVMVPAGAFTMGSPDEEPGRGKDEGPLRRVTVARPYAVGRFKVTRGEYQAFLAATGRAVKGGCVTDRASKGTWAPDPGATFLDPGFHQEDNHPAVCVTYDDALAYAAWINGQTQGGYRLLTEAEWEFAARAGTTTAYPWGSSADDGCDFANTADLTAKDHYPDWPTAGCRDGAMNTSPVGTYRPNRFGLYDMIGNDADWVQDCATQSYAALPLDGSADLSGDCTRHVVRGGSWGAIPKDTRVANRVRYPASQVDDSVGIRLAKTLE